MNIFFQTNLYFHLKLFNFYFEIVWHKKSCKNSMESPYILYPANSDVSILKIEI